MTGVEKLKEMLERIELEPQEPTLLCLAIRYSGWTYHMIKSDGSNPDWKPMVRKEEFFVRLTNARPHDIALIVRFAQPATIAPKWYSVTYNNGYSQYTFQSES